MILVDSREHQHAIRRILDTFDEYGYMHASTKLYVGDYQEVSNGLLVVDRKQNLQEVAGNVCQQHARFRAELERAALAGIHLIVLVEHGGNVKNLEDVEMWNNPRLKESPGAITGERLAKVMRTMADKYGVEWRFCDKRNTGKVILEILYGQQRMDKN